MNKYNHIGFHYKFQEQNKKHTFFYLPFLMFYLKLDLEVLESNKSLALTHTHTFKICQYLVSKKNCQYFIVILLNTKFIIICFIRIYIISDVYFLHSSIVDIFLKAYCIEI